MVALRITAWVLVGLAIALLGADGVSTLEAGLPVIRTTQEVLSLLGLDIALLEGGIGKPVNFLLTLPLWAVFGVVGVVLTLVFRPID